MWHFLSYSGVWDQAVPQKLPAVEDNKPSKEQMQKTKAAIVARARYRHGKPLAILEEEQPIGKEPARFTKEDEDILALYYDDSLRKEANRLTLESGNGRLHQADGNYVDIGASTGGYIRKILQNWKPPNTQAFEDEVQAAES